MYYGVCHRFRGSNVVLRVFQCSLLESQNYAVSDIGRWDEKWQSVRQRRCSVGEFTSLRAGNGLNSNEAREAYAELSLHSIFDAHVLRTEYSILTYQSVNLAAAPCCDQRPWMTTPRFFC